MGGYNLERWVVKIEGWVWLSYRDDWAKLEGWVVKIEEWVAKLEGWLHRVEGFVAIT
jgi:hypothetical protein